MKRSWTLIAAMGLLWASPAQAHPDAVYRVEITNITKGQTFTPILIATHKGGIGLFELGAPASTELEILAEAGDTGPQSETLEAQDGVGVVTTLPGLLGPGQTATTEVVTPKRMRSFSVAAMLIPTNDTFFALQGGRLPSHGTRSFTVPAYDAGTEENDQSCPSIPGPPCFGDGYSPEPADGDEGFVFIGNGFHQLGPEVLDPFTYDWRNPVARITVRRMR